MTFQKMVQYIKKKRNELKILFMGLDNAGKTTLLNILFELGNDCPPTFGYNLHRVEYKSRKLNILDIGGQACFKDFWNNYFEHTDGIVFVVDCIDNRSFHPYLNDLIELKVPICLMINKIDQNPDYRIQNDYYQLQNLEPFLTSSFSKETIAKGLDWLIDKITVQDI